MATNWREVTCPSPDLDPRRPKIAVPPGACDTHAHLYEADGPYPLRANRPFTPPPVTVDDYRAMLAALGLERAVIVHSGVHEDHQVTIDALRASGGRWKGIAVADPAMTDEELADLDAAGFRGVRFNPFNNPDVGLRGIEQLAGRIEPLGWHVQLHLNAAHLEGEMASRLEALPVDIVVDHLGHMPTAAGIDHPGFQRLLGMVRDGRCWVKLSAPMRFEDALPPYPGVTPFARALVEAGPARVVWGSDWPHVIHDGFMPNDADLLDLLAVWAPDEAQRKRILVDNPAALYGFAAE
jgi:predicted TIM-barrel fold metal-dependent hydrolase